VDMPAQIVRLCITDNGAGFAVGPGAQQRQHGLDNMQERMEAMGGGIRIETGSKGSQIVAEVPLPGGANVHNIE